MEKGKHFKTMLTFFSLCCCYMQDQQKALELLKTDPNLKDLQILEAPLFDLEIRGVPALKFMGDVVWK
jgi:arsenite-transporting ATPase